MARPPIDVDRIVKEVLAQLGLAPASGATGGPPAGAQGTRATSGLSASKLGTPSPSESPSTPPQPPAGNELVVHSRVVTLAAVEGRLAGVRRLVVPPQAVVTPAVRDALQQRHIALEFASPAAPPAAGSVRLVLVSVGRGADHAGQVKALAGSLANEGVQVQQENDECLIAATERLAGQLRAGDALGLLLTTHTAAAVCLANRHQGVRAVSGADVAKISAAVDSIGANLLVLDASAVGLFQLAQIVGSFCRGGVRHCPEIFAKQLG